MSSLCLNLGLRSGDSLERVSHGAERIIGNMRFVPSDVVSCVWSSPIGGLLIAAHEQALLGIWFQDQSGIPIWATAAPRVTVHPVLDLCRQQLIGYFAGDRRVFDLPVDLRHGTSFERAVWAALQGILYGQTVSYGDIARRLGKPTGASRAVGGAVGRNPVGIIIPCHRVVGQTGALTGYTGGLDRKVALLRLEQG